MGCFYFDESIHPKGNFALGAWVYAEESLDRPVAGVLRESGLTPHVEEFKSRSRMDQNPRQKKCRELLNELVRQKCGIGVVIAPDKPRRALGLEAFRGLRKILGTTTFRTKSHNVFPDQGIPMGSSDIAEREAHSVSKIQPCSFHFERDSRNVLGLQAADLVAHSCAIMLLFALGILKKTVKAGEHSGYDPDSDIGVDFELWAGLRWNFFGDPPPPIDTWQSELDWRSNVSSRGLHVADSCSPDVRSAALDRFGNMYLGCIH